jgi:hypothetical protein
MFDWSPALSNYIHQGTWLFNTGYESREEAAEERGLEPIESLPCLERP